MNIPSVRVLFDRKHVATKTKKGLVQIEISYKGKRKWLSANVKLYKDQWNNRKHVINCMDSYELNEYINKQVFSLERWIRENVPFSWDKLDRYLKQKDVSDNFVVFVEKTINDRNDIKESTKKSQRKLITILREYGKIKYFSDLTPATIMDFDNWLHGRKVRKLDKNGIEHWEPMRQQSLYDYHKTTKTYIRMARRMGLMKDNPYELLNFKRGESEEGRLLSEDELKRIEDSDMRNGSVARAKDMFLFQVYTGLSYADLREFDFGNIKIQNEDIIYSGKREKTGKNFSFLLLPKALEILQKYDNKLPIISIEGYNQNLKKVAIDAGIDKPISSHWARRTAATVFINRGIRIEVIAKILGHTDIATTLKFYARLSDQSIADEMKKAGL